MYLAQLNIARMLAPINSPLMADFVANLDRINSLAESSSGFVWRLKDDNNNATSIKIYDDDYLIVNMSVWEDIISLHNYVYKTAHSELLKRKKEWFEKFDKQHMVLWYTPVDYTPSVMEALERLEYLQQHGDSPYAFGFKKRFSCQNAIEYQKK